MKLRNNRATIAQDFLLRLSDLYCHCKEVPMGTDVVISLTPQSSLSQYPGLPEVLPFHPLFFLILLFRVSYFEFSTKGGSAYGMKCFSSIVVRRRVRKHPV
jgi:hypothetical protein